MSAPPNIGMPWTSTWGTFAGRISASSAAVVAPSLEKLVSPVVYER